VFANFSYRTLGRSSFPAAFVVLFFPLAVLVGERARAQSLLWNVDESCIDLDAMGDVDGDGVIDVVADAQSVPAVKILSGVDGSELQSYAPGTSTFGFQGYSVAGVGDVDGDGFLDLLVGDPGFQNNNGSDVGRVIALSGQTGAQLYYYQGWDAGFGNAERDVGTCVAGLGDTNGDGLVDFAYGIGVEPQFWGAGPSRVTAVTAHGTRNVDFAWLWHFDWALGGLHVLAALGDVNGNGRTDFAVSVMDGAGTLIGSVEIHNGGSGVLIWTLSGTYPEEHFGDSLGSRADLDGDGVRELLIGCTGSNEQGADTGRVDVVSGATGVLLFQMFGEVAGQRFGADETGIGDVDGDGLPDLVVASYPTTGVADGRIELFSGADGRQLARIDEGAFRVRGMGDLDGDGIEDVVSTTAYLSIHAWKFELAPTVASVTPSRIRYDRLGTIAVHGTGFTSDPNLVVTIDGVAATGVAVTSFTDLTCTPPPALATGPHDVIVTTQFGTATLAGGLVLTPAVFVDGDALLGAIIDLRFEFDPLDATLAIVGYPPQVSIPTPPFDGALGIVPFVRLFTLIAYPTEEYVLPVTVPNDPALVGVDVLLQSLTGPKLGGAHKDGAWTNVAVISIH